MQYQVPQFIEVEDKIFGPLTIKQFVYVAGGAGLAFVLWKTLPSVLAMPFIGAVGALAVALAFFKVNNRPFIIALEAAFMFITHSRLYLWQANRKKKKKDIESAQLSSGELEVPNLAEHKLKQLAWSLDINENIKSEREKSLPA